MSVSPVPEGFNSISPYLVVKNGIEALEFYGKAFGAETVMVMPGPDGQGCMHAEMRIGDSVVMMSDENPQFNMLAPSELAGTSCSMHLYLEDVDAAFGQATEAGCEVIMPPMDMFWGDRMCKIKDVYGHVWGIATHKEDVPPEEMEGRNGRTRGRLHEADGRRWRLPRRRLEITLADGESLK